MTMPFKSKYKVYVSTKAFICIRLSQLQASE
jgi:hypothetical protein